MKTYRIIAILILILLLPVQAESDCYCSKVVNTFLPYARRSKSGLVALVKVLGQKTFDLGPSGDMPVLDPFPIQYLEVEVLRNFNRKNIGDTVHLLLPGEIECCLAYPRLGMPGDSAFIHAFEWDEADYGYNHDEFKAYAFSSCMRSVIVVKDGYAIGPITRNKEQKMRVAQLIRKL